MVAAKAAWWGFAVEATTCASDEAAPLLAVGRGRGGGMSVWAARCAMGLLGGEGRGGEKLRAFLGRKAYMHTYMYGLHLHIYI